MTVRVLQVLGRSEGGIVRHVATLVEGLDGPEIAIDIAAPDLGIELPKPTLSLDIPKKAGPQLLRAGGALHRMLDDGDWDVVHAHGLRASLVSLRAARGAVPVIATLHNLIRPEIAGRVKSLAFKRGETTVVRRAARVFAVSAEMEGVLRGRAPEHADKVELLRIGLPEPRSDRSRAETRRSLGVADTAALVLTVARLVPQKALHVLLQAAAQLDGTTLAIAGDGRLRAELERLTAELGITDRVRFLGARTDVGDLLGAADVFALSSSWEARALAAQEAILMGVPVVSTDVGGMPELVEDRVSGRLVPPGDPAALAVALKDVLSDPGEAKRYAERARASLTAGYSAEQMLARVRAEYLRLGDG